MGVGKEEIVFFENVAKRQVRIYPDAADIGVRMLDAEMTVIRMMYKKAAQLFGKPNKHFWGAAVTKDGMWGVTSEFKIPIEYDGGCEVGTKMRVDYCWGGKVPGSHKIGHVISINFERYSEPIKK